MNSVLILLYCQVNVVISSLACVNKYNKIITHDEGLNPNSYIQIYMICNEG